MLSVDWYSSVIKWVMWCILIVFMMSLFLFASKTVFLESHMLRPQQCFYIFFYISIMGKILYKNDSFVNKMSCAATRIHQKKTQRRGNILQENIKLESYFSNAGKSENTPFSRHVLIFQASVWIQNLCKNEWKQQFHVMLNFTGKSMNKHRIYIIKNDINQNKNMLIFSLFTTIWWSKKIL